MPELDKLFNEIGTYRSSTELKELLDFVKRFPKFAPYNAMLIHVQKPGSCYVASASEWRYEFKRDIIPGARPLVILRPFGPVAFVFELSDTEGDVPFPEQLLNPFKVEGTMTEKDFHRLIKQMLCDGILYHEAKHGTASAGFVQVGNSNKSVNWTKGYKTIKLKIVYDLVVNQTHFIETKFATLLHELGHIYCGHLGSPHPKWWEDRQHLGLNEREFEAECVCWLVCERMGLKNPSAAYLSGYLNDNDRIPEISIDTVLKAVGMIESMIRGQNKPRKELMLVRSE